MNIFIQLILWIITSVGSNPDNQFKTTQPRLPAHLLQMPLVDDEPITVRGHVRTNGGQSIPGVSVTLTRSGQSIPAHNATTDASGNYEWDSVFAGNYTLTLSKANFGTRNIGVTVGTQPINRVDTLFTE